MLSLCLHEETGYSYHSHLGETIGGSNVHVSPRKGILAVIKAASPKDAVERGVERRSVAASPEPGESASLEPGAVLVCWHVPLQDRDQECGSAGSLTAHTGQCQHALKAAPTGTHGLLGQLAKGNTRVLHVLLYHPVSTILPQAVLAHTVLQAQPAGSLLAAQASAPHQQRPGVQKQWFLLMPHPAYTKSAPRPPICLCWHVHRSIQPNPDGPAATF